MDLRPDERTGLAHLASHWWRGADPGEPVEVTIRMRRPTHRTTEDVGDLFAAILEPLAGGYPFSWGVSDPGLRPTRLVPVRDPLDAP